MNQFSSISRAGKYIKRKFSQFISKVAGFFKRRKEAENAYEKWTKIPPLIDVYTTQPGTSTQVYIVCFNYIECPYNDIVEILSEQESLVFIDSIKTSRSQLVFTPRLMSDSGTVYATLGEDEFDTALLQNNLIPLPLIQIIKGTKTVYRRLPVELCEQVYDEAMNIKAGISLFPIMSTVTVREDRSLFITGLQHE